VNTPDMANEAEMEVAMFNNKGKGKGKCKELVCL
jgi:hypothetical protein